MSQEPRMLEFDSLDDVVAEAERLLAGAVPVGNWTLGQVLHHLAMSIRGSRRGRPDPDADVKPGAEPFRETFFQTKRLPRGIETPERLSPPTDADAAEALGKLKSAIAAWERAEGPFPSHPVLGLLNKEEWTAFHRIHCAHHLAFILPAGEA